MRFHRRNRVLARRRQQKRIGSISVKTADGADMKASRRIRECLWQRMKCSQRGRAVHDPHLTEILQAQEAGRVLTTLLAPWRR